LPSTVHHCGCYRTSRNWAAKPPVGGESAGFASRSLEGKSRGGRNPSPRLVETSDAHFPQRYRPPLRFGCRSAPDQAELKPRLNRREAEEIRPPAGKSRMSAEKPRAGAPIGAIRQTRESYLAPRERLGGVSLDTEPGRSKPSSRLSPLVAEPRVRCPYCKKWGLLPDMPDAGPGGSFYIDPPEFRSQSAREAEMRFRAAKYPGSSWYLSWNCVDCGRPRHALYIGSAPISPTVPCAYCGREFPRTASKCPNCGGPVSRANRPVP